jgi:hypothetical protein
MSMVLERQVLAFIERPDVERFESIALKLYSHQRKHNLVYARYCESLAGSEPILSWKRIPAVPQQAFKHAELRSFPPGESAVEFRTSGTTGQGFGRHYLPSLRLYEAAVRKGWDYFCLPDQPLLLLMPDSTDAPYSSLSRMGSILCNHQHAAFFLSADGTIQSERLRNMVSGSSRPITLFGTALAFLSLLQELPELPELPLPYGSILMETGGFKGSGREISKEELYGRLSRCFRVAPESIWNEYGMTELSSQFYSCGLGAVHRAPPWVRFMVIDPNTNSEAPEGEVGLLRVFDLANLWSVIAVQTQDLAIAQGEHGFLLLGRDPRALPRGGSRAVDELIRNRSSAKLGTMPNSKASDAIAGSY